MAVRILDRAGDLLSAYDVLFCDVWGVLHNGVTAYPGANDALPRFRETGGSVVLVSNAPVPRERVARLLDLRGVRREAWDAIVSSGDLTRARLRDMGLARVHHVGPAKDSYLFDGLDIARVGLDEAEALVVSGLEDEVNETGETYRPLLQRALDRGLELVCANPDLVVEVGGVAHPCAGAIAAVYESMGGAVHWAGKPFPPAYDAALAEAARLRGGPVPRDKVLAIGDAVRTDLAGAARAGIAALFVADGIHREHVTRHGRIDEALLAHALGEAAPTTVAAMPVLRW